MYKSGMEQALQELEELKLVSFLSCCWHHFLGSC